MATIFKKKDIDLLEKVQRRATRLMTSDKSLSYSDRLQKFGLSTLETRRLRGDLIRFFRCSRVLITLRLMISSSSQAQL